MAQYAAALDQGTTSTRCMIFDHGGNVAAVEQLEHEQIYPKPGWVEHDPGEIWQRTRQVMDGALGKVGGNAGDIAALGVTNQRETTVVWDRNTGEPVYNAIVWQDTRTDKICDELSADEGQDRFRLKTGLPIATYFSGPKIRWILENVDGARERAEAGDLIFGNTDTWCIWNLTGGTDGGLHVTDPSNASRTMLMNLETLDWDDALLDAIGVPRSMLPEIKPSSGEYGEVKGGAFAGVEVAGDLGDQQAATFGQTCFSVGEAKNTYGTGNFLLLNTGTEAVQSKNGLITTVGYKIGDEDAVYCLEGSIAGLTRYVNGGHLARAALEATAFQSREVADAMNADSGVELESLKVDGGMVVNETLMQFQADILGVPVIRPKVAETTSLGAAYAAGLATGFWGDVESLRENWVEDKRWEPQMDAAARDEAYRFWKKAVERTFDWAE
jgi:glycerol kinase